VKKAVDASESPDRKRSRLLDGAPVANVEWQENGLTAQLFFDILAPGLIDIGDHHACALIREGVSACTPDAGCASGDDDNLAVE
jgi:hypothetical protein